jgi:hypothetical protein
MHDRPIAAVSQDRPKLHWDFMTHLFTIDVVTAGDKYRSAVARVACNMLHKC